MTRLAPFALGAFLLGVAAPAAVPVPQLTRCIEATARLDVPLNSAVVSAGDAFGFTLLTATPASDGLPAVPKGARGYGVVAYVRHAGSGGLGGLIVLEPRFVVVAGDKRVPVMGDPSNPDRLKRGSTRDAPGALEYIPVVGLAFSGYNALHRGREVSLGKGTPLRLLIGEGLATSSCFLVQPQP